MAQRSSKDSSDLEAVSARIAEVRKLVGEMIESLPPAPDEATDQEEPS